MVWVVANHLSEHWMDWLLKNIGVEMSEEFVLSLVILVEVVLCVITSLFVQEFTTTVPQQFGTLEFMHTRDQLIHFRAVIIEVMLLVCLSSLLG